MIQASAELARSTHSSPSTSPAMQEVPHHSGEAGDGPQHRVPAAGATPGWLLFPWIFTGLPGMGGRRQMTTCFQCLALYRDPQGSMCAPAKGSARSSTLLPNKDQVHFPKHILPLQTLLRLWRSATAPTLLWAPYPHPCAKDTLAGAAGCTWLLLQRMKPMIPGPGCLWLGHHHQDGAGMGGSS